MARILVISPTPTHPPDAGNRARTLALLSGLKEAGHQISFAFVKMEVGDEVAMERAWDRFYSIPYVRPANSWWKRQYELWARRLGTGSVLPYGIDDWFTSEISIRLHDLRERLQPDVVLVEYVFLSKALEYFGPETLKILDTHDIFSDRHLLYRRNGMIPSWFYTTVAEENKGLGRAEVVVAIQEEEAAYFSRQTDRKVITVGHLTKTPTPNTISEQVDRLLFVGSANPINVDALQWFLTEVFPRVRRQLPGIELEIVGECAKKISAAEGLLLTGRVSDIAPHYHRAKAVINPVRFGTGLKIKTVEGLAMGRPLITTRVGAAGLREWAGKAFLVADSPESFAEAIQKVFSSPNLRSDLVCKAMAFTIKNNQAAMQPLLEVIDGGVF